MTGITKACIIGASGKLGRYMVQHALDRGYEVVGVCRPESVDKLAELAERITIVPGRTNDREVIGRALRGCDGVLTVLAPWGRDHYASGTAQAVLDLAEPGARLVFSCGWHITRDGKDVYSKKLLWLVAVFGFLGRLFRFVDIDDQVEACRRIFASDRRWTVVRGSDLEEGESEGLPVWSRHVGDPILASNRTRRIDFGLFMVAALEDDALVREAPAICGRETASARRHADAALAERILHHAQHGGPADARRTVDGDHARPGHPVRPQADRLHHRVEHCIQANRSLEVPPRQPEAADLGLEGGTQAGTAEAVRAPLKVSGEAHHGAVALATGAGGRLQHAADCRRHPLPAAGQCGGDQAGERRNVARR